MIETYMPHTRPRGEHHGPEIATSYQIPSTRAGAQHNSRAILILQSPRKSLQKSPAKIKWTSFFLPLFNPRISSEVQFVRLQQHFSATVWFLVS